MLYVAAPAVSGVVLYCVVGSGCVLFVSMAGIISSGMPLASACMSYGCVVCRSCLLFFFDRLNGLSLSSMSDIDFGRLFDSVLNVAVVVILVGSWGGFVILPYLGKGVSCQDRCLLCGNLSVPGAYAFLLLILGFLKGWGGPGLTPSSVIFSGFLVLSGMWLSFAFWLESWMRKMVCSSFLLCLCSW